MPDVTQQFLFIYSTSEDWAETDSRNRGEGERGKTARLNLVGLVPPNMRGRPTVI